MAQGQRLTAELKLTQKLSPLQIQTIKLIELPAQELEAEVRRALEENPVLEEDHSSEEKEPAAKKEVSLDEYGRDDTPSWKLYTRNWGPDEKPEYNTFSVKESFTQSLQDQLGYLPLDERRMQVANYIICSLEGSGYLRTDLTKLVDDMAFRAGIETTDEEAEEILKMIQGFDPAGVGARNLRECLLLQLRRMDDKPSVQNAIRILEDCYDEFSNKHWDRLRSKMNIPEEDLEKALKRISRLNPSPGGAADDQYLDQAQQIVPDFILRFDNDEESKLSFEMPRMKIPELKLSRRYERMLESGDKDTVEFVRSKFNSAKWFIEAIKQRYNTLSRTMQAIIDFQKDYFMSGDEADLRPMVLKDIAEMTGFDISTISRVVNSKYIETYFGTFRLKDFFSEGIVDQSGEERSTREIKKALQEIVDSEDKHHPYADDRLATLLQEKGFNIARRTIAKYREQLSIPTARLRKGL